MPEEKPVLAVYIRDLVEADLGKLGARLDTQMESLVKIRHRHHALARALAEGMTPARAAMVTGFGIGRVAALQNDPAFIELCAVYAAQVKEIFRSTQEKIADLKTTVVEELQERLDEKPEQFTNKALTELLDTLHSRAEATEKLASSGLSVSIQFIRPPPREMIDISPEASGV